MSYQDLSQIKDKINIDSELVGDSGGGTLGYDIFIIHILEQIDGRIKISYDYLMEKFSKEDILNINNKIISFIEQVINNENISIENIQL
jgi:hypothetical protein